MYLTQNTNWGHFPDGIGNNAKIRATTPFIYP